MQGMLASQLNEYVVNGSLKEVRRKLGGRVGRWEGEGEKGWIMHW
jgi:hypothetical protein